MNYARTKSGLAVAATGLITLSTFYASVGASIVPIGAYRFEETSYGQIVADESGNHLDGVNAGLVFTNVSGPPTFGSASNFQDGWVDLGRPPELIGLLSNFTLTAWIHPDSLEGFARIMGGSYGSGWGWGLNNGNLRFTTYHIQDYDIPVPITPGSWNHVAVTFDSSYDATFYLNGVSLGTVAGSSPAIVSQNPYRIGTGPENFHGILDEVGVFQGVLTPEEIRRIMDEGVLATDTPLVPGDANGDGCVTGADFTIWADNFDDGVGIGGKTWREGDWTGEGYVTGADFTIWSDNFGTCAEMIATPEPASLALAGIAVAGGSLLCVRYGRVVRRSGRVLIG